MQDKTPLHLFESINPTGAALISFADTSHLRPCLTKEGEINLFDERRKAFLHSDEGALKEALSWSRRILSKKKEFLVVFGIGLGWYWKALLPWLHENKERRVVFIEDDISIISSFLDTPLAHEFFLDPQTTLFYIDEKEEGREVFETIAWSSYKHSFSCEASPFYNEYRQDAFQEVIREITTQQDDVETVLDEFFHFGHAQLRNFARNLFLWKRSAHASALFHKFANIPAIITGAGPSLEKALPLLRSLSSRALILSGGSSTNALLQGGVTPHATASCDPNPLQYLRLRQAQPFALPLFFRSRTLHEGIMTGASPLIYMRGADGYPIVNYFEEELHVKGRIIEGGHSVSNLLIELAHNLGCRPIIMVGYDLAYTEGARYALSVSESLSHKERLLLEKSQEVVSAPGSHGKMVLTEPKWLIEASWIENFQKEYPRLPLINCAEEGLLLNGIRTMPFAEAVEKFVSKTHPIDSLLHLFLEEARPLSIDDTSIAQSIEKMGSSLSKMEGLIDTLSSLAEKTPASTLEDSFELQERGVDIESELSFHGALRPFFMMHEKLFFLREKIDCRPLMDDKARHAFRKAALLERCSFIKEAIKAHKEFLFSLTSWASFTGCFLKNALSYTPPPPAALSPNLGERI